MFKHFKVHKINIKLELEKPVNYSKIRQSINKLLIEKHQISEMESMGIHRNDDPVLGLPYSVPKKEGRLKNAVYSRHFTSFSRRFCVVFTSFGVVLGYVASNSDMKFILIQLISVIF